MFEKEKIVRSSEFYATPLYLEGLDYFESMANEARLLNTIIYSKIIKKTDTVLLKKKLDVLDIGVSTGRMTENFVRGIRNLTKCRMEYDIVEPNMTFINNTKSRLISYDLDTHIINKTLQNAVEEGNLRKYDIILASHCFYHIQSEYINSLIFSLNKNGFLLVILSSNDSSTQKILQHERNNISITVGDLLSKVHSSFCGKLTNISWKIYNVTSFIALPDDAKSRKALFSFLFNRAIGDIELSDSHETLKLINSLLIDSKLLLKYNILCIKRK